MTEVARDSEAPGTAPSALLTFLLADIRGFTKYSTEHGDRAAARLSERFLALCRDEISAHEGEVFGSSGDQVLAAFTSAHAALYAALALQSRLEREQTANPDLPVRAGVGLDIGEGIRIGSDYRGNAINLAARLCSIAGPGEIFASEDVVRVARAVEGLVAVDRGEVTLKGLPVPVRVVQIGAEGALPDDLPPLQPILVTHPTNLPDEPTPFIGRAAEIDQIARLLREPHGRLVTLTGPGGTGKTRLALQVGAALLHDFPDGVFFCDLSPLTDASFIPSAIAEVLDVREEAGKGLLGSLIESLKERHLLLVLDNFEHLLDGSTVVSALLDSCRNLHILITSRIPLHLSREREHAVPPLAVPDPARVTDLAGLSQYESVRLFIERAKAARDSFTITATTAPAVAEICFRLDGLPLAIELAAARIKLFPPAALLHRLDRRLTLLTGGARDRPSRQQTLRGAIDWSYSLLNEEEQTLFARLSVFAGGGTFEAAEEVCNPDGDLDLLEGLTSLVDKSLIRQAGEEPRFSMLETLREYATERLEERGERSRLREQHATYFVDLAESLQADFRGPNQRLVLSRLREELANVREALRWSLEPDRSPIPGLRLAVALLPFWLVSGLISEGREWLVALLSRPGEDAPALRARALHARGTLAQEQSDREDAERSLAEALALFRQIDDKRGIADALHARSYIGPVRGEYGEAITGLDEALSLRRELGDRAGVAETLGALSSMYGLQGLEREAADYLEEATAIYRQLGNTWGLTIALSSLGIALIRLGELERAEDVLNESLPLQRSLGNQPGVAVTMVGLAQLARLRGQLDDAAGLIAQPIENWAERGNSWRLYIALTEMAAIRHAQGRHEVAAALLGSIRGLRERGDFALPPRWEHQYNRHMEDVREALTPEVFDRAFEAGRQLDVEGAASLALNNQ